MNITPGEILAHKDMLVKYPEATKQVETKIRQSRSVNKNRPFADFVWRIHLGSTFAYSGRPSIETYRISACYHLLFRNSSLFNRETDEIVPGNWSF